MHYGGPAGKTAILGRFADRLTELQGKVVARGDGFLWLLVKRSNLSYHNKENINYLLQIPILAT